jgi:uncharacterized protein
MIKIILSVLLAPIIIQIIKTILNTFKTKKLNLRDLYNTGGMPSSHSALVTALATGIFFYEGWSTSFIISLVFAGIVIRDALGVRLTVGREGEEIKKLLKKHHLKSKYEFAKGHTPFQATVGGILGILIAVLIYLL